MMLAIMKCLIAFAIPVARSMAYTKTATLSLSSYPISMPLLGRSEVSSFDIKSFGYCSRLGVWAMGHFSSARPAKILKAIVPLTHLPSR